MEKFFFFIYHIFLKTSVYVHFHLHITRKKIPCPLGLPLGIMGGHEAALVIRDCVSLFLSIVLSLLHFPFYIYTYIYTHIHIKIDVWLQVYMYACVYFNSI